MHINIGSNTNQPDQRVDKLVEGHSSLTEEIRLTDEWVESIEKQVEALNKEVSDLIKSDTSIGLAVFDLEGSVVSLENAINALPKPEKPATVDLSPIYRDIALLRARVAEIRPVSLIPVYTQIVKTADSLNKKIEAVPTETEVPVIYRVLIGLNLLATVGLLIYLIG